MAKAPHTVDLYIAERPPPVQALLNELRAFFQVTLPEAEERMKWGAPVWCGRDGEPVIYLYGGKDHANLGFVKGADLNDAEGLLEGKGKAGRHVKLWPGKPVPKEALAALVCQAAGL